jgi:hypothetical protein
MGVCTHATKYCTCCVYCVGAYLITYPIPLGLVSGAVPPHGRALSLGLSPSSLGSVPRRWGFCVTFGEADYVRNPDG